MKETRHVIIASITSVIFLAVLLFPVNAQNGQQPQAIRMAMTKTLVTDLPEVLIDIALDEFKGVMKKTTGLPGEVTAKFSPGESAEKLQNKELDFALLFAHEYAWAQKKYPGLRPFLIAATKKKDKRAHIIVHKDGVAKTFADLRGKKLDLPLGSKEYCRIYLDKLSADKNPKGPADFFGSIVKSPSQLDALDEVARGKADATVIDTPWLDFYKDVKGAVFAKNLRVLQQSAVVPPAVIVYTPGALEAATVNQVRDGLLKAHTDARGRALMALWHIDAFEAVPEDFAESLAEVLKAYPPPISPR